MPEQTLEIYTSVHAERAESFEEMVLLIGERMGEVHSEGKRVVSISHAIDRSDQEDKPYSFVLFAETR